ncbi:hypothetical protein F5Y13DRAFT_176247 [Hypoxylon sp. FL1857]|nr:hypothetical protein F5Y13DRAFT_176247 [Hypoxylon sp. FL1857]
MFVSVSLYIFQFASKTGFSLDKFFQVPIIISLSVMSDQALNFEPLKDEELGFFSTEDEFDIVDLFESVISSSPEPNIDDISRHFTDGLIELAPGKCPTYQTFPCSTWSALNHIASRIPYRHYGQDVLVSIIRKLNEVEGWKGLPDIWIEMRECWNQCPSGEPKSKDDPEFTEEEWLSLNSFAARLYGGLGVGSFTSFAVYQVSDGLEGERKDKDQPGPETRLRVACEWVIQSGRRLMRESLLNSYANPLEKLESRYSNPYSIGPLFTGSRGFNLERWGFWKRRLIEVREDKGYGESTYELIDEAVETMAAIEKEIAEKFHRE